MSGGAAEPRVPPVPVAEGEVVGGKYAVGRVLAAGGMGVVVEGRHTALDQRVAIKFLLPDAVHHPDPSIRDESIQRFLREARAAAKIESDHIVRVFDVGTYGRTPYMVMEYLDGEDLDGLVARTGALSVAEAVEIALQAVEGLAQAHALGIVHRDLKPSNVFLSTRGPRGGTRRVKLVDFGISKIMPEAAAFDLALTNTRSLLGSPAYMSPEQVRSTKNVDPRTDVWSIGVIVYEMLIGEPAFSGETVGDVFAKIREEPLVSIRSLRPEVPAELDRVLMRCLERDRTKRYADAGALLDALLPFSARRDPLAERPQSADDLRVARARTAEATTERVEAGAAIPVRPGGSSTHASWTTGKATRPSARWAVGVATAATIVATSLTLWWVRSVRAPDRAAPRASEALPSIGVSAAPVSPPAAPEPAVVMATSTDAPNPLVTASPSVTVSSSTPGDPRLARRPPRAAPAPSPRPTALPPPPPKKKDDLGI